METFSSCFGGEFNETIGPSFIVILGFGFSKNQTLSLTKYTGKILA
jgi:hypothetical protein